MYVCVHAYSSRRQMAAKHRSNTESGGCVKHMFACVHRYGRVLVMQLSAVIDEEAHCCVFAEDI